MKYGRSVRILALAISLSLVMMVTVSGELALAQSITISPSSGSIGTKVTVTGTAFHSYRNSYVYIYFGDNYIKNIKVSETGTFTVDFDVPGYVTPETSYMVTIQNKDRVQLVKKWFIVTAGMPPPKSGGIDLYDFISMGGIFTQGFSLQSADNNVKLSINKGTTALIKGEPLSYINITKMEAETGEPPAAPEDAHIIGAVYDIEPNGATFEPPIIISFSYKPLSIPEGVAEENLIITWWDEGIKEWSTLENSKVDTVTHTISTPISHFTPFTVLAYTRPAAFSVSALNISPAAADMGERVNISVLVSNTGDLTSSYEVTLRIDNAAVDTTELTLTGGTTENVTFTVSREVAGSYAVDVNDLSGTFIVRAAPPPVTPAPSPVPSVPAVVPPVPPEPIDWFLVGSIIIGVLVIAGGVYWLFLKAR